MAAASSTKIKVAPTSDGCCLRIQGRGTMLESPSAEAVARRTLEADAQSRVVFDLSECSYLDSTFLGCLVQLFRGFGRVAPARFHVAASSEHRKKLLGACHLDQMIPSIDAAPAISGEWVNLTLTALGSQDMTRHVMECHKHLAEVDGPMKGAFTKIAEQLERELTASR